jgi:two-component system, chemotaxis family, chemotaxis protein CheY
MPTAIVVDDSRAIRMILGRTLRELGFEVREAGNGIDALAALSAGPPADLVMADWNMPVMDGLELLRRIRASAQFSAVPVVMVTTEAEIDQMTSARGRRHRIHHEALHQRDPGGQTAHGRSGGVRPCAFVLPESSSRARKFACWWWTTRW